MVLFNSNTHLKRISHQPMSTKVLLRENLFTALFWSQTPASGRHLQVSWKEREWWDPPGPLPGSSAWGAAVAFPEAEAKRVIVKLTAVVVTEELPLVFVLSQGEAQVGLICQDVSAGSSPEDRGNCFWGQTRRKAGISFTFKALSYSQFLLAQL